MPAYNVEPFIEHSVSTILGQSLTDLEVIIVDDGSTDGTRDVIQKLARSDERVRAKLFDENRGVSATRNTALDLARGRWIAIVDPDDWVSTDRLEALTQIGEAEEADAVCDNQYFIASEDEAPFGELISTSMENTWQLSPAEFVMHDLPDMIGYGVLKPVFRRSFLEKNGLRYREDCSRGEDCLFMCECLARHAKVFLTTAAHYYYRVNRPGSATNLTIGLPSILNADEIHREIERIFADITDPRLKDALAFRSRAIDECMKYRRIADPLKSKQYGTAAARLLSNPTHIPPVTKRFLLAVLARLQK